VDDRQEFLTGVQWGLDPQPAGDLVGRDGRAVTSVSSPWNHKRCRSCGHSFRRGDEVLIGDGFGNVVHADPWLDCTPSAQDPAGQDAMNSPAGPDGTVAAMSRVTMTGDATGQRDAAAFAVGLLHVFPVAGGIPVRLLEPADWRVPRSADDPSPTCLYCGHTFRAGECVVVCPCRPLDPRCGSAVHRDPAAGLTCWEAWRPDSSLKVCPVTLSRVGARSG